MIKIDGNNVAKKIINELKNQSAPTKSLVAVLVGDDPASLSFLKIKERVAGELGVDFKLFHLEQGVSQDGLEKQIERLSNDDAVGGIIVQLPLPDHINRDNLLSKMDPKKDIDNLTGESGAPSPAAGVVEIILDEVGFNLSDKTVAVVGSRGFLVGQPVLLWFGGKQLEDPSLEIKEIDIEVPNLKLALADVDLIISGVGKENLIDPSWLKEGAGVIDFGYPADLKKPTDESQLAFYTPTPGGTGPILVAELFSNFFKLNSP